jgi:protein O-GlcNAc transferase
VADRVQFLPRQPYQRFLELLSAADVVIDTPHFNGMNTSIDAFSVGTPVVTLPTNLQRGRFTQAMYRTMEIDWGVASDADEYARLAVEAAADAERQHGLRQLILERNHLLFEDKRAVEEFERFFLTAHRQATAGST